ncbi:MAG: ferritin-like domain-containing protein [Acidobacteriota bacterium]
MGIAWHAPYELLKPESQDMARAIHSLMEELEAIDWYGQRMDVTHDEELRLILEHNRDEEKEHAAMILEWIRRRDPKFDQNLRQYLFTSGSILDIEESPVATESPSAPSAPETAIAEPQATEESALTVGSLRGVKR